MVDAAPFLRAHRRQDGLGAEKGRLQVHRNGLVEILFGEIVDAAHDRQPRIVNEDVDGAERRTHAIDHLGHRFGLRHIGRDRDGAMPRLVEVGNQRVGGVRALAIIHRNCGAGLGERNGNRCTDASNT